LRDLARVGGVLNPEKRRMRGKKRGRIHPGDGMERKHREAIFHTLKQKGKKEDESPEKKEKKLGGGEI